MQSIKSHKLISFIYLVTFDISHTQTEGNQSMSQFNIKSPQHCAKHQGLMNNNKKKLYKGLFCALATFLLCILSVLLFVWFLFLHPSKPQFYLKDACMNISSSSSSSLLQLTILSKNPNQKIGIYYDHLEIYASSYKDGQQMITNSASLPPFYQQSTNLLTVSLSGMAIPWAASSLAFGSYYYQLVVNVNVQGRLRWMVGTWVFHRYPLKVDCVCVMDFSNNVVSFSTFSSSKLQGSTDNGHCSIT